MSDPFSIASSAVGMVSLGLTACQGLLNYYVSWKGSYKDVAATCASLEALSKIFELIEVTVKDRKFSQAIVERVIKSIDLCQTGVHKLNNKLAKVKKTPVKGIEAKIRSQLRRTLYPFKQSTLLKLRETVFDLRDNLTLAIHTLQVLVLSPALDIASAKRTSTYVFLGLLLKSFIISDASAISILQMNAIDGILLSLKDSTLNLTDGITMVHLGQNGKGRSRAIEDRSTLSNKSRTRRASKERTVAEYNSLVVTSAIWR